MDRRLTPANGRVAAARLRGSVEAERYANGELAGVAVPVADLLRAPRGPRERQLLLNEAVTVYERRDGWAFVQAAKDDYVGYLEEASLGGPPEPTHWVTAPASVMLTAPKVQAPEAFAVSFGALVAVTGAENGFAATGAGYLPERHLAPVSWRFSDPVAAAELFMGVPYLWGGNSVRGIDCSGLVQAGCVAAGIACPGDSDMQAALGTEVPADAPLRRGDLVFWDGHVGWMADADTLLHANAHHMAVAREPLAEATGRIAAAGGGPVTARRRV